MNRRRAAGELVPEVYESRFLHKDGSTVPVEVAIRTLQDGDDAWVLGLIRDITVRKAGEDEVRRLAAIVASTSDAVVSVSLDGTVTSWNAAAERLFGHSAAEALGRQFAFLSPPGQEDEMKALVDRVRAGGTIADHETRRRHRDGRLIPVSLSASPVLDDNGELIALSATYRDISHRLQAEEERRRRQEAEQARAEADAASRAKSEFLSRMSHELRTPLNAILGFAQLLELDAKEIDEDGSARHILAAGRHLLGLIDEILDLARIEAGRTPLSLEPVLVDDVIGDVIDLVHPLANARGIDIRRQGPPLAVQHVRADRQRLRQVLLNLLSNAVKYNRDGGRVVVSCEARRGKLTRIAVADTGPGIAQADLPRLFTPFDRIGAEATGIEGTGLGLALSKGLVELMDGRMGVESRPGEGSTFWIELRAVPGLESVDAAASVRSPRGRAADKGTILYIEDNASNILLVDRILRSRRPTVRLISSPQASLGLDLARQHRPDLILLDLHLPDRLGREVLLDLKADSGLKQTPVVILSADATIRQSERLVREGAHAYLTKPLDVPRFLEVVDEVLAADRG